MKDHFSQHAVDYALYRPSYPKQLFDFILEQVGRKELVWDCGTGNGQTAIELASSFKKVIATDISQSQLDQAPQASNVFYSVQPAEQTDIVSGSVDLITVSQALHWFDFDKFYEEVNRVANAGAWLAVWSYSLLKISTDIDKIIAEFHFHGLSQYWDAERKFVDAHYTTIPFPFVEIATPVLAMEYYWSIEQLAGYLSTWSAVKEFISINHQDPIPTIMEEIKPYWEDEKMRIIFPIHLRMGRVKH